MMKFSMILYDDDDDNNNNNNETGIQMLLYDY